MSSTEEPQQNLEKELPTVSFVSKNDRKKYRDKKRKERKIKREKGGKVKKIEKQEYHSDSENENDEYSSNSDDDNDYSQDSESETEEKEKITNKKPVHKKLKTNNSNKTPEEYQSDFSSKLQSILNTQGDKSSGKAVPILKKYTKSQQEIDKLKKEKKDLKDKQKEKQLLASKDYKPIEILQTPEERELSKIAKRGVIKLFNAVTKHQQGGDIVTPNVDEKSKKISKNQFLDTLKNAKVKSLKEEENSDDEQVKNEIFDEDYMYKAENYTE
ncbi:hypothetical protein DLAC_00414 [Tieghemostelium lacteum]|uniref:Rrp15p-domain-containing protein n=1 Tax=Tieghemostelium lacteum TaxID=361077 RepID=A0A152A9P3_TIELA|nr:hypothetical protein DLAC_00414 [Tieghemostelium lacteum]|eukprot:KYR02934.1 hypothetical protein DLAC_00414 [Tieghemostelium lacteum]